MPLDSQPSLPPLCTDTVWAILRDELTDDTVNQLVWHYLGYRYDPQHQRWDSSGVEAIWAETYPIPLILSPAAPPRSNLLAQSVLNTSNF
jgi:hypothetical protein